MAEKEKEVSITLSSGSKYRAQIISADDDADLALLKIEDQAVQFPYFDLTYTSPNLLGAKRWSRSAARRGTRTRSVTAS